MTMLLAKLMPWALYKNVTSLDFFSSAEKFSSASFTD